MPSSRPMVERSSRTTRPTRSSIGSTSGPERVIWQYGTYDRPGRSARSPAHARRRLSARERRRRGRRHPKLPDPRDRPEQAHRAPVGPDRRHAPSTPHGRSTSRTAIRPSGRRPADHRDQRFAGRASRRRTAESSSTSSPGRAIRRTRSWTTRDRSSWSTIRTPEPSFASRRAAVSCAVYRAVAGQGASTIRAWLSLSRTGRSRSTTMGAHRVIVVEPATSRIVWQYGHTDRPSRSAGWAARPGRDRHVPVGVIPGS